MFSQKSKNPSSYSHNSVLDEIKHFTYPQLYEGKEWYIGFYAYDPAKGKLARKRIKINRIKKKTDRRKYAAGLIYRLTRKLESGWNPWIEAESNRAYSTWDEVCEEYVNFLDKQLDDDILRPKTHTDYIYRLRNVRSWNADQPMPITYIYQFNREFVTSYLNYTYLDQDNSPRTRNNYLNWFGVFSSWLVEMMYIKVKPTDSIQSLRTPPKSDREVISDRDLMRLHDYLQEENKFFLLACYIAHYALIRPKEMSFMRIRDFSITRQSIFISGAFSKNRKDAIVTLPSKIIRLMIDLNIFQYPDHYYLFSNRFLPGAKRRDERQFREYWATNVRKKLGFPKTYKFYSLKDTGITNMLRKCDVLSVRDQARHSSILMTNMYTPQDIQQANDLIKNYDGIF